MYSAHAGAEILSATCANDLQDPYGSLNPRMTVGQTVREILATHHVVPRSELQAEASRVLRLVGLGDERVGRYPHEILRRSAAEGCDSAGALCSSGRSDQRRSRLGPRRIGSATILNLLRTLQKELGVSYIFISHDLATVRYMSDFIAVMYLGQVVEVATTDELLGDPQHPYTRALVASVPTLVCTGERLR